MKECKAAHVHFTDYNEEVIERNLMDSVFINEIDTIEKISASSGDWSKLELKDEKEKFKMNILSSLSTKIYESWTLISELGMVVLK